MLEWVIEITTIFNKFSYQEIEYISGMTFCLDLIMSMSNIG